MAGRPTSVRSQLQLRLVVPEDNRIRRVLDLVSVGSVAAIDSDVDAAVSALRELGER